MSQRREGSAHLGGRMAVLRVCGAAAHVLRIYLPGPSHRPPPMCRCINHSQCTRFAHFEHVEPERCPSPSLPTVCPVLLRSASFKNKENVDLSRVANYARTPADVGSTEVQIARLTARVQQMSAHLKSNRKDFSSRRGLEAVLSQRKSLMQYLYRTNRAAYDKLIVELGIRSVVAGDSHKAAQRAAAAADAAQ